MYKYIVLSMFLIIFFFLNKKNRIYIIPFILIIFSNINGLLDWEDFAFHGFVKFRDYGLLLTLFVLLNNRLNIKEECRLFLANYKQKDPLYSVVLIFWAYYSFEFFYSILLQGGGEWPIKMGRTFFYGIVIFVIYERLKNRPIEDFEKVINTLMGFTLVFGLCYLGYNLLGMNLYPTGAHEVFEVPGIGEVKRNFSGFPSFAFYFLILFVHRIMIGEKSWPINFFGMMLMLFCVLLTLTRGAVMTMVVVVAITVFFRYPTVSIMRRALGVAVACVGTIPLFMILAKGHWQVLLRRFSEFVPGSSANFDLGSSANFVVRSKEFSQVVSNVIDFNPFFGFGFTNISELGLKYQSRVLHMGSADNGFTNLIGVTGFAGLSIFLALMLLWLIVNVKLQLLNKEQFSKVNFIFMLYMMASMLNGATMSYMHNYALFLAYDLLAYSYLSRRVNDELCQTSGGPLLTAQ